jgi:hypothetical protein
MIADNCKTGLVKRAKQFFRNSCGGLSVPMGLTMIPLLLAAGVGVDTVRVTREQAAFQAALDSAVIALAADERSATEGLENTPGTNPPTGPLNTRMELLKTYAMKYVNANYKREKGSNAEIKLHLEITGAKINLKARHKFPMSFMRLVGIQSMEMGFEAEIEKAMRPVEVVLVMDTTGSMSDPVTVTLPLPDGITTSGQIDTKLESARFAAKKFLNTLYSGDLATKPSSPYIRVGLVPFSSTVRLNSAETDPDFFKSSWIDKTGANPLSKINFNESAVTAPSTFNNYTAWSELKNTSGNALKWNGCVEARKYDGASDGLHINDTAPNSADGDTLFPAFFTPDAFGPSSSIYRDNTDGLNYIGGTRTAIYGDWYRPNRWSEWRRDITGYNTTGECKGLSNCYSSYSNSTTRLNQQENYLKYIGTQLSNSEPATPAWNDMAKGPWGWCVKTPIMPMTYDRASIENGLDNMVAYGATVISEGVAWGNRVLSPGEPFEKVKGFGTAANTAKASVAAYNDVRWMKVMLLMTDGDNSVNSGSYTAYGRPDEPLATNRFNQLTNHSSRVDTYTKDACDLVKKNKVILYVSSFGDAVNDDTKKLLEGCATKKEYYKHSGTANDLVAAFDHFGTDTVNRMVYVSK